MEAALRGISCFAMLATAAAAAAGPEWCETGDAGELPDDAQAVLGTGPLERIVGTVMGEGIAGGDFQDMYLISITADPLSNFSATVRPPVGSGGEFNSQLWLFKADGRGLLGNDDQTPIIEFPSLPFMADDGSGAEITETGVYLLAISGFNSDPVSASGGIFFQATTTEVSGPDGPGGAAPVIGWSTEGETGGYIIEFTGVEFVPADGDVTGDGLVNFVDLIELLAAWGLCAGCPEDLDGDGDVDLNDLLILLANWTG